MMICRRFACSSDVLVLKLNKIENVNKVKFRSKWILTFLTLFNWFPRQTVCHPNSANLCHHFTLIIIPITLYTTLIKKNFRQMYFLSNCFEQWISNLDHIFQTVLKNLKVAQFKFLVASLKSDTLIKFWPNQSRKKIEHQRYIFSDKFRIFEDHLGEYPWCNMGSAMKQSQNFVFSGIV
jgi:hypothetical protein